MFWRTPTSSSAAELSDLADLRAEHLKQWRHAAQRAVRAYKTWSAAGWRDRHDLYLSFLEALRLEERAARQVELDTTTLGATTTRAR